MKRFALLAVPAAVLGALIGFVGTTAFFRAYLNLWLIGWAITVVTVLACKGKFIPR